MPTFGAPLNGISHSDALKQAITHAESSDPILVTLSMYNATFVDGNGNPTELRIVRDFQDLLATLEAGAPLNGGQQVTFTALPFELVRPSEKDGGSPPEITLRIDGVSRQVLNYLKQTMGSLNVTTVTLREYLTSDTSAPHTDPPLTLELTGAEAHVDYVEAKASFGRIADTRFPADIFDNKRFPGLSAR